MFNFNNHSTRHRNFAAALFILLIMPCEIKTINALSDKNTVTVVVPAEFPPHYSVDKNGKPHGFAIDVMDKIAELAGLKVRYVVKKSWGEVFEDLHSGRADLIPNLGITEKRKFDFAFTVPVETSPISIFVRKGMQGIEGKGDLFGRKVAVVKNNTAVKLLEGLEDINLTVFNDAREALFDLLAGHMDALVYPETVTRKLAQTIRVEDRIKLVGKPLIELKRAIAARKGDTILLDRLNESVKNFVHTQEYNRIFVKWHGKPTPFWAASLVAYTMGWVFVISTAVLLFWRYRTIARLNINLLKNIAERELAEDALRENENFLNSVFEGIQDGISVVDNNFNLVHTNSALDKFYPDRGVHRGQKCYEAFHGRTKPCEDCTGVKSFRTGTIQSDTVRVSDSRGESKWVEITAYPLKDENGVETAIIENFRDVTERKRAEKALRESELQFKDMVLRSPFPIVVTDPKTQNIMHFNDKFTELFGYTTDDVNTADEWWRTVYPDPAYRKRVENSWTAAVEKALASGKEIEPQVWDMTCKDGSVRTVEFMMMPLGSVSIVAMNDLTERKRAEQAIENIAKGVSAETGDEFFRSLVGYLAKDLNAAYAFIGQLTGNNSDKTRTLAVSADGKIIENFEYELAGSPCINVVGKVTCVHPDNVQQEFPADKLLAKMNVRSYIGVPLFDSSGNALGILVVMDRKPLQNRSMAEAMLRIFAVRASAELERKRAEEELRSAKLLLEKSFNSLNEAIFIIDPDTRYILSCNPAVERIFGYAREEVLGRNTEFLHVDRSHYEKFGMMLVPALDAHGVFSMEFKARRKDGTIFLTDHSVTEIKDESGKRTTLVSVVSDITKRKLAEEELRSAKLLLEKTFSSLNEAVFVVNPDSRTIIAVNPAVERLFGYSEKELIGRSTKIVHVDKTSYEKFDKKIIEELEPNGIYRSEYKMRKKDGTIFLCDHTITEIRDESGKRTELVGLFTDITEKRLIEQELLKTQKLESLSLLAGGIAHDFNNILMGILGNISLAKFLNRSEKKPLKVLEDAEKAAIRAKGLTAQLLTFSTGGMPLKNMANMKEILTEVSQFALRGSKSKAVNKLDKNLAPASVDSDQITQVINNLLINADQAMPDGGIITLRGKNITLNDAEVYPLPTGQYVKISIEDNGAGIEPDIIDKIFDPFFTTKTEGNGLGLSTSYSIIKNHGGLLKVSSMPGEGSSFHIYLPSLNKPVRRKNRDKIETSGNGKILVMDDDKLVRNVLAEMLSVLGYKPELAHDGEEAEKKYAEAMKKGEQFAAVILDLTVRGGMGGKQAMKKLKEIDPNVNAIVSSGYSTDIVMEDFGRFGFSGYVTKPYELKTLSKVLNKTIRSAVPTDKMLTPVRTASHKQKNPFK